MDIRIVRVTESPVAEKPPVYPRLRLLGRPQGLPVYLRARVLSEIHRFLSADLNNERGGILIGSPCQDRGERYVEIVDHIPAEMTEQSSVHMKFTLQSWARIEAEFEARYPAREKAIVGWYHSHPRLSVFVSSSDEEVHKLFRSWYQTALVLDPAIPDVGFFANDPASGRLVPVGGYRLFGDSDEELDAAQACSGTPAQGTPDPGDPARPPSPGTKWGPGGAALLVGLFLSGLLLGSWTERGRDRDGLRRELEKEIGRRREAEKETATGRSRLKATLLELQGLERGQKLLALAGSVGRFRRTAGGGREESPGLLSWFLAGLETSCRREAVAQLGRLEILSGPARRMIARDAGTGR